MPIEVTCTGCNRRMRMPDKVAGKRVRCPKCQDVIDVPAARPQAEAAPAAKSGSRAGRTSRPVEQWTLQTEDGEQYGPVPKSELDEWMTEGRVTAECQLLRDGADQWQWATDVYPHLEGEAADAGGDVFPGVGGSAAAADEPTIAAAPSSGPFDFGADDMSPTARVGGGRKSRSHGKSRGRSSQGGTKKSGMVTGIAVTNYVIGALQSLGGVLFMVMGPTLAVALGTAMEQVEGAAAAKGVVAAIFIGIGIVFLLAGVTTIVAGIGVAKRRQWGRILTLVLGGLSALGGLMSLLSLSPTVIVNVGYSVYVFVVLLNKKYAAEFQ